MSHWRANLSNPSGRQPDRETPAYSDAAGDSMRGPAKGADVDSTNSKEAVSSAQQERLSEDSHATSDLSEPSICIDQLIDDHHAIVYRYAFRLAGQAADAEDLTQQTFLAAQMSLSQLRSMVKARSWLLTICRNRFLKNGRRQRPISASAADLPIDEIQGDEVDVSPFDEERLHLVLETLPEEYRIVVLMFYFEQLSYREIAEELDVKIGTVMSRLSRAKEKLRLAFDENPD